MLNAIQNIYSINKLVEQSSDDQIIRATNTKLKADDNIKTYFYVRKNKIDQVLQKLTDWTDGAKAKQALAKIQIITNLKFIKDDPDFDKKFPNKAKRDQALALMNKIIMTLNTTEKDITSSMIKKDLGILSSFLRTYETIEKKSEHSDLVEDSSEGNVAQSEAEFDLNAVKGNNAGSKANISKNIPSHLSKLANVTSVDVAEVIINSKDLEVDGRPYKETDSKLAQSTTNNNAASVINDGSIDQSMIAAEAAANLSVTDSKLAQSTTTTNAASVVNDGSIDQGMIAAEAATENTPSRTSPISPSTQAEIKASAKANPYLESLKTKWSANENGYFEVSNSFYITSEMPTSKMLAQAYLLPEGKKLEFFGKKDELSHVNGNRIAHGEHELRDDLDLTDEKRALRPYLKLEVKLETKPFQPSTKVAPSPAVLRLAEQYKNSLVTIYTDSVQKISDEYKKTNLGKELESLVIAPITSTEGILLEVETAALVSAIKEIQLGNPGLKIAISADKEAHSDAIRVAYEE